MDTTMSLRDRLDLADRTLDDRALDRLLADISASQPPLVKGGQGRTDEEITDDASATALLIGLAVVLAAIAGGAQ
jgi:hypothetical protein